MIPFYYVLIAFAAGALCGGVAAIVMKPAYDRTAEQLEVLTANKAQAIADHFSKLAAELRKPGK